MPKAAAPKPVENLTYEQALAELEGIVSALEEEQNPLNEAMKLFERGQALVARCSTLLEQAELKVKQLSGGNLVPFEDES
jgi:exodeoxyribonuclease VII small subunit